MGDLQFSLVTIGFLIIAGVLLHGLWTLRRDHHGQWQSMKQQILKKKTSQEPIKRELSMHEEPLENEEPAVEHVNLFESSSLLSHQEEKAKEAVQINKNTADVSVQEAKKQPQEEIFVIHVNAKPEQVFSGEKLLHSLTDLGLKHGAMNIFHRHQTAGKEKVIFSVANAVQPGSFDVNDLASCETIGVSFFMMLPCAGSPMMNFSLMFNTAQQLADDLDGELVDEHRAPWTPATKENYVQRIRAMSPKPVTV